MQTHDLAANVKIVTLDDEAAPFTVKAAGEEDALKELKFQEFQNTFHISGSQKTAGNYQTYGRGVSIVKCNEQVWINGRRVDGAAGFKGPLPELTIAVPKSCALVLGAVAGQWEVKDSYQPARFSVGGEAKFIVKNLYAGATVEQAEEGKFQADKIMGDSFTGSISGIGKISVQEIATENASFKIAGSGDIKVKAGKVTQKLTARIAGSGDIAFKGVATDADLAVAGSGDIKILQVINQPPSTIMGSGEISVKNWPI